MKKTMALLMVVLWSVHGVQAQARRDVRAGNEAYQNGDYPKAESSYQKGLQKDSSNYAGLFNLGNAWYQQKQYEQARAAMKRAASKAQDKTTAANAHYNAGNTYMEEKKWAEAIEHYKKALRKNPQDTEAKYNLSYAQKMLKKEGGGGDNKNQDKNQDKKEQPPKESEKKDQQDPQNQHEKPDLKKPEDEPQKPQPAPSRMSQEQADQLLNALQQEEKKVQDKLKKGSASPVRNAKDW